MIGAEKTCCEQISRFGRGTTLQIKACFEQFMLTDIKNEMIHLLILATSIYIKDKKKSIGYCPSRKEKTM